MKKRKKRSFRKRPRGPQGRGQGRLQVHVDRGRVPGPNPGLDRGLDPNQDQGHAPGPGPDRGQSRGPNQGRGHVQRRDLVHVRGLDQDQPQGRESHGRGQGQAQGDQKDLDLVQARRGPPNPDRDPRPVRGHRLRLDPGLDGHGRGRRLGQDQGLQPQDLQGQVQGQDQTKDPKPIMNSLVESDYYILSISFCKVYRTVSTENILMLFRMSPHIKVQFLI